MELYTFLSLDVDATVSVSLQNLSFRSYGNTMSPTIFTHSTTTRQNVEEMEQPILETSLAHGMGRMYLAASEPWIFLSSPMLESVTRGYTALVDSYDYFYYSKHRHWIHDTYCERSMHRRYELKHLRQIKNKSWPLNSFSIV